MKKIILLSVLLVFFQGHTQNIDSLPKPKIGLVLSGGGAKGLAHIGVLKVLEKYGIRPDFIGGTSMGAIVGSLYAAGYSAAQIDSLFHTIPFDDIMYNRFDRKYKSPFVKEHGKKTIIDFPFSTNDMSIALPRGLSDSQRMFNLLADVLLPVQNIEDFSKLKIPYLCISTDIVTGKQVLFNKGYLAKAATSSALLPSVFRPLEENYHLLLDGGIVNNYPVEEVRDLGGNFIIGSDVQGQILEKDQIKDMAAILDQIIGFEMYKKMPLKIALTDLYIRPDINGIGITDFEKIDTIIARGEKAAEIALSKYEQLNKLQTFEAVKGLNYQRPDSLIFDQIIIKGQQNFKREYILGKIGIKPHLKVSYHNFLDGINNLIGSDNFETVHYRFKKTNNQEQLIINLKERLNKASMGLGFHYNELYKINVLLNFKNKRIFNNNDLISSDIIGGNFMRYNFDYFMDNGFKLSWGIHSDFHQLSHRINVQDLFKEENYSINKLDFNYLQQTNNFYFQGNLNHFIYLKMGLQHQYKTLFTYVFSSQNDEAYYFGKNHYFGNFASINIDSRDDCYFPTKGLLFKLKWTYNWSSSDYYRDFEPFSIFNFNLSWTQKILKPWYIQPNIKTGLHLSNTYNYDNIFYIGGMDDYAEYDQMISFKPMSVLTVDATKFTAISFSNIFQISKKHFISIGGHYLLYDKSNDILPDQVQTLYGYHIDYGINSFLGPLKLNFGRVPKLQRNYFNISLGYEF
jgi:NTE family protein